MKKSFAFFSLLGNIIHTLAYPWPFYDYFSCWIYCQFVVVISMRVSERWFLINFNFLMKYDSEEPWVLLPNIPSLPHIPICHWLLGPRQCSRHGLLPGWTKGNPPCPWRAQILFLPSPTLRLLLLSNHSWGWKSLFLSAVSFVRLCNIISPILLLTDILVSPSFKLSL